MFTEIVFFGLTILFNLQTHIASFIHYLNVKAFT